MSVHRSFFIGFNGWFFWKLLRYCNEVASCVIILSDSIFMYIFASDFVKCL